MASEYKNDWTQMISSGFWWRLKTRPLLPLTSSFDQCFLFLHLAQEAVSSLTIFAAVAGVLGVIVLFLAVALVMLYKRYGSPQSATRVVYTKTANEEGKLLV